MSTTKDRITRKLESKGMAWAVTANKTILPEDGFDAKPTYHIHPERTYPHQRHIQRFHSLAELEEWINNPPDPDTA